MSTTGRRPVIAAPTPIPVNPASEIGVSRTRSDPNSSTSPDSTLKGVPASATSSPKMHTRGSRRISSASASRTACANVNSRIAVSGINVLVDLLDTRIRSGDGKLNGGLHLFAHFVLNFLQCARIGDLLPGQPFPHVLDGIPLGLPLKLFLLRAVIFAIDVADMMPGVTIRVAKQQRRPLALACPAHQLLCNGMDAAHILPVHAFRMRAECGSPRQNVSGSRFRKMRVLRVEIVLANINDRQLIQSRQIHHFIQHALAQRPFAKKTNRKLLGLQAFRRKRRARCNSCAAPDDRVGTKIPRRRIRNMHRAALAATIAGFLTQKLRKHPVRRRCLRQAMPVATVRAGDVIGLLKSLTDPTRNRSHANVQVREPRHQRARIKFIHLLLKQPDAHHLPVQPDAKFRRHRRFRLYGIRNRLHAFTPDICANTSNTTAKSFSTSPMPRAAVRNSFVTAVVGIGTSSCRPSSSASSMSFCIMLTLNHASAGRFKTNGPRYCTIGDAITLCVRTSTATSRAIPLFSASSTPSLNASICTARLKLVPIFITSARPLSPTYVTFGPMSSSNGFTFSKVSLRPPTITESFPSCSVITLPDTGASTMSPPFSRIFPAISRLNAGLTVLISTNNFPGVAAAIIPSGPFITAPSAAEFVTIEKITSDSATTARGVSAHFIPFLISHSAFERVRLYPVTLCPLLSSRFTISLPITPRPTNPNLAKTSPLPNRSRRFFLFALFARRVPRILAHLFQVRLHRVSRNQ